jgi:small neutral amino acid transporter SnatA (MarC family)
LILFILIGLFARFDFVTSQSTFVDLMAALVSILAGATFWWTALTYTVSHFRRKLNNSGLRIINRISGSIIVVIALISMVLAFF